MINGKVGTTPGPRGVLYFPPGRYRLGSTLVFPQQTGQHIFGCGMAQRVADGSAAQGCESVIFWSGTDGGTMIEYQGEGLVWNGVDLWGDKHLSESSSSSAESRAGTAFLIKRPSTSSPLQAGKIWFGSLRVEFCDTAVATASDSAGAADEVAFGYFWAETVYVRFTVAHFVGGDVSATIDRSGSTSGQTVLELIGCKTLAVLENNVMINGPSASNKSRVIVRDSQLLRTTRLVDPMSSSSHYTDNRVKNWLFGEGVQEDIEYSG